MNKGKSSSSFPMSPGFFNKIYDKQGNRGMMKIYCRAELTTIEVNKHLQSLQFSLDGDVSLCL